MAREDEATRQARIELAAALRWAARQGFQSGVCNHFSVAMPGRPDLMLINPEGYFWAEARASDMVVAAHDGTLHGANGHTVETTTFCIHAPIHRLLPQAVAVLHTHMHHATAICMRKGGEVSPSYLSAMSFYQRIAYDRGFIGPSMFSVLVLMGVVTTLLCPIMFGAVVKPHHREQYLRSGRMD